MTKPVEKIQVGGRSYSRFIAHPKVVRDGTFRCITCGQIDEVGYHDDALCLPNAALAATSTQGGE